VVRSPTVSTENGGPEARAPARVWAPVALLAILASVALQVFTLSDGHGWGGDFALYVLHARNLAEGHAYADTGYVVNPLNRPHSPSSYPPVYPSLLASLYAKWGLNYTPFKAFNALCLAVGLWFLYQLSLSAGAPRMTSPCGAAQTEVLSLSRARDGGVWQGCRSSQFRYNSQKAEDHACEACMPCCCSRRLPRRRSLT
jgi:hypothetical protein